MPELTIRSYADATDDQVITGYTQACDAEAAMYAARPFGTEPSHAELLAASVGEAWMREGMRRGIL